MEKKLHIMIVCGEVSGDLHASMLAEAIKEISPDAVISGIGGAFLRSTGARLYYDIKDLAVMGFFDVLKKLPRFVALKKLIMKKIDEEKPDALIFVDFSGFNLRVAKAVNRRIRCFYYVSPQVWASRPGRVKTIQKYIHTMIVLFKFEEEFYKARGVDATFVGHPFLDIVKPTMARVDFFHTFALPEGKHIITLLPGSRKQEIRNILPVMIHAARRLNKRIPNLQFVIVKSPQLDWELYGRVIESPGIDLHIVEGRPYDCIQYADFCLIASGTATLEAAILKKPFCVVYKTNLLNYLLYRPLITVPYISIVNILAKKRIVAEFIQFRASGRLIARHAARILKDPAHITALQTELGNISCLLGEKGAALRAARVIVESL
ncbi:MAG: lipid-A-disaccharide synthase [Candidatus Omnitrophota bacterium]